MSLLTNLVSYYRLDGNSNDSVGTNNGTDTAITYGTSYGKINQGALFNGTSSYISLGNTSALKPTAAITVAAWIYVGTYANYQAYVVTDGGNDWIRNTGYGLVHTTGTAVGFWINNFSTNAVFTNLASGSWYHVVGTYDGANIKLYVNGSIIGSFAYTSAIAYSTEIVSIGAGNGGASFFHNGYQDEIAIYSRAITSTEVSQLYNNGAGNQYPFYNQAITRRRGFLMSM